MSDTRYRQFCALARAAEVIGERWTLLVVRELLLGPKRFSDLRDRLDGISPSVLTERLGRAEVLGLVRQSILPPPAASTVYELTEDGRALEPAILELIRWGGRYLLPARKGDRFLRRSLEPRGERFRSPRVHEAPPRRRGRTRSRRAPSDRSNDEPASSRPTP